MKPVRRSFPKKPHSGRRGFTLIELLCAIVVLAILATLSFPLLGSFKERTRSFSCQSNLKGLGAGSAAYMTDHGNRWPQISAPEASSTGVSSSGSGSDPAGVAVATSFASQWIAALAPYGISDKTWRCPSIEAKISSSSGPSGLQAKRLDYVPTSFDSSPGSAYQWPGHPWFIERGPTHGSGPNLLLTNGRVVSMQQLVKEIQ